MRSTVAYDQLDKRRYELKMEISRLQRELALVEAELERLENESL